MPCFGQRQRPKPPTENFARGVHSLEAESNSLAGILEEATGRTSPFRQNRFTQLSKVTPRSTSPPSSPGMRRPGSPDAKTGGSPIGKRWIYDEPSSAEPKRPAIAKTLAYEPNTEPVITLPSPNRLPSFRAGGASYRFIQEMIGLAPAVAPKWPTVAPARVGLIQPTATDSRSRGGHSPVASLDPRVADPRALM